jgi:hypothetical protein
MNLNFNHGRGSNSHFLRILISLLWLWVISIMWNSLSHLKRKTCEEKANNKVNYQ